jgi:polysaccharide biosynthesis transport protein
MHGKAQLASQPRQAPTPTLRDLASVFFRYQKLFVTTFLIVLGGGLFYALWNPSYASQMKVLVRHGRIDPAVSPTPTSSFAPNATITEEELNSAVELFRGDDILHEVVVKTKLAERQSWLSALRRESLQERTERAVSALSKALDIQPVRKSQVITVRYHSYNPELSAAVLKTLGEEYLIRQRAIQRPPEQSAFFEEQVRLAFRELQKAQYDLEGFIRANKLSSAALERDLMLQKLSEAQAGEFALQASVAEAQGKARLLDENLQQLPPRRVSQVRNSDNPQLQEKLKSKLLELELRRTQLLTKFQSSYRLVQEMDQQIAQTRTTLEAENLTPVRDELTEDNPDYAWARSERVKVGVELQALESRENVSRQQVESYETRAQQLATNAIEQSDLEQKLKTAKDKYLLYLSKREEARIGDELDLTGILNVAIAQPPFVPAFPETPLWLAACLSIFAAGVLSTASVFIAHYLDPRLRTPSEVAALLGIPVIASLPAAPAPRELRAA